MTGVRAIVAGALVAACSAGCGFAMRPVPLDATPADWEALAGEWRGDYTMTGHDRHGLIAFRLKAAERQAAGDVLMMPDRFAWPYGGRPSRDVPPGRQAHTDPQLLSIRFVSAEHGMVRGSMDPYWETIGSIRRGAS